MHLLLRIYFFLVYMDHIFFQTYFHNTRVLDDLNCAYGL